MNKVILVLTILLAIGYINSSVPKSCHIYPLQQLNLVKNHNHQFQKLIVDENVNGENLDVCLFLYEDSYKHLNTIQLSLVNVNNNNPYGVSPILFYKQWFAINLRDNNPLCVRYQNSQNIKLTMQLQLNIKRSGQNHLVIRNMKVCHTSLQINPAGAPWPPLSTITTTETTATNEPDGNWTVPTWPSTPSKETTTTKIPGGDWTVPTWPSVPSTSWTAPTWPLSN